MGPGDPIPYSQAAQADAPDNGAPAASEPVRIQARIPDSPRTPGRFVPHAPFIGAAGGLFIALLFILLSPGQAVLVLVLTLMGAVLGAIAKSAFHGGIDFMAAWRALRRS